MVNFHKKYDPVGFFTLNKSSHSIKHIKTKLNVSSTSNNRICQKIKLRIYSFLTISKRGLQQLIVMSWYYNKINVISIS